MFAGPLTPAFAASDLQVSLTSETGTPDFDQNDDPGNDSSADNDVIRTNDQALYTVQIAPGSKPLPGAQMTLTIPKGQELRNVPAFCKDPADPSVVAEPTPAMNPPSVPLTASSWQSLPQQSITCALGDLAANLTQSFQFPAFQRSEVPNGTVLTAAKVSFKGASVAEVTAVDSRKMVVSAKPRWDLSKNGVATAENSGDLTPLVTEACKFDSTQACYSYYFPLLISGVNGGKGLSPLAGPVMFTELINPASFYGDEVVNSAKWQAAGANANNLYAPRIRECLIGAIRATPGTKLGDPANAVRDSGKISCSQAAPGQDVKVTITDTDWSLYTYPSKVNISDGPVPDSRAYAVSMSIWIEVPVKAVQDFGTGTDRKALTGTNRYTPLQGMGLDGTAQVDSDDPQWNNYRTAVFTASVPGGFTKFFAGVPGDPNNTPPAVFSPRYQRYYGPPGGQRILSGQIQAGARQTVISMLSQTGSYPDDPRDGSTLYCDVWDNAKLQLRAGDYPGLGSSSGAESQAKPSGGAAVWNSGLVYVADEADLKYTVKYGHADNPGAGTSDCRSGQFFDRPEDVPGNDPTLMQQGIYSAVNQVRIWATIPKASLANTSPVHEYFSIALSVVPGQKNNSIIPNWATSQAQFEGFLPEDALLSLPPVEKSTYDPVTHGGLPGDRLLFAPAYTRVDKTVVDVDVAGKSTNASADDEVVWTLTPKLSSSAASSFIQAQPIFVEDCLPAGLVFDSATVVPSVNELVTDAAGMTGASGIECPSGNTFLRFDLGDRVPNQKIDPVVVTTRVSQLAEVGTYTNVAVIQTDPADPSPLASRSSSAQVSIQQVAGVKLEKTAVTPQVQVNPTNNTKVEKNVWKLTLANLNSPQAVSNADVIDVLPTATGVNGSKFAGTMDFDSASVSKGSGVRILYTSATSVNSNPRDTSNGSNGIAWCDAAAGGTRVLGTGDCPGSAGDVTGLRFQKPGDVRSGDVIEAMVTMIGKGNVEGDTYVNVAEAVVDGLKFNVGPANAPETVVASSIGDTVWLDFNANGIQDDGAAGVAGFPVSLSGTDKLGNQVTMSTKTNADGVYHFTGLRDGDYTVTFDPAALKGAQGFTVKGAGNDTKMDSDGDANTGVTDAIALDKNVDRSDIDQGITAPAVVWNKTDGNTLLGGAEWELKGPEGFQTLTLTDCDQAAASDCAGADKDPVAGQFRLVNLPQGDYVLTETKAPSGFVLGETAYKFSVSVAAFTKTGWQDIKVNGGAIENTPRRSPVLPLTGGLGSDAFYLGGGGLLLISGGLALIARKRGLLGRQS